MTLACGA